MADIYIIKERLKLLLALVGAGVMVGAVVMLKFHGEIVAEEGSPQYIFSAVITGALALAWVAMLLLFFVSQKIMRSPEGLVGLLDRIPWRVMGAVALVVTVAALAVGVYRFSDLAATPFDMLRAGELDRLKEEIMEKPAILNVEERAGRKTLLEIAYSENLLDAMELLLSHGAVFDPAFIKEHNPVLSSVESSQKLRLLLVAGLDANPAEGHEPPLQRAVKNSYTESIGLLLEAGADVNIRDERFRTPLLRAVEMDNLPMVIQLVEAGADINIWDRGGDTALHTAVQHRKIDIVRCLMQHGANPKTFNFRNYCPFHLAANSGQNEMVELFLAQPELIKLRDKSGRTAFEHALLGKRYGTARLLLRHGANIDRIRGDGYTMAHVMVIAENYNVVKFLIEEGADIHIPGPDGETAHEYIHRTEIKPLLVIINRKATPPEEAGSGVAQDVGDATGLIPVK